MLRLVKLQLEKIQRYFSLGWWGSCAETASNKMENGLFGEKEERIGCE